MPLLFNVFGVILGLLLVFGSLTFIRYRHKLRWNSIRKCLGRDGFVYLGKYELLIQQPNLPVSTPKIWGAKVMFLMDRALIFKGIDSFVFSPWDGAGLINEYYRPFSLLLNSNSEGSSCIEFDRIFLADSYDESPSEITAEFDATSSITTSVFLRAIALGPNRI